MDIGRVGEIQRVAGERSDDRHRRARERRTGRIGDAEAGVERRRGPPAVKVAVAPADTCGPLTTSSVLVASTLAPLLVEPSLTVQSMVRAPVVVVVVLKVTEFERSLPVSQRRGVAGRGKRQAPVPAL